MTSAPSTGYRDTWLWNFGFSAYWFATSWKWFILLLVVLPGQVERLVPAEVKNTKWGLVVLLGALWAMVGPAIFGGISDRIRTRFGHRQPFIAVGTALTCVALFILSEPSAFWVLMVGYLLLQISDDVGTGPYAAMVAESVPENKRGRASAIMSVLQLVGQIGSAVAGMVIAGKDADPLTVTRNIYLGVAIVNVVCAVFTLVTIRNVRAEHEPHEDKAKFFERWVRPFHNADFRWVWFTRFLNALGFYLVTTYLRYFFTDTYDGFVLFGKDIGDAGTATNVIALSASLFGALGSVYAARKADVIGKKPIIVVAGVLAFCAMAPFPFVRDFTVAFCLAAVFGLGNGLFLSADWALVSDVLPNKKSAGTEMGVWASSSVVVQFFSGAAGTLIDGLNRWRADAGYTAAFMLAGFLYMIGATLIRQVKGSR